MTPQQPPMTCCPPRPPLRQRPLLPDLVAAELEGLFKVLANGTRLRMLHAIVKSGELCVTDLAQELNMKPQAVSNQLQRLTDRGMVATRRNGNNVFYRVVDPCVIGLLDQGLCLMEEAKKSGDE
jgi:ArsR family transcriptional regulator, lead/cadmium/zinc/bismuth-responsive transcriptional repressor